MCGIVASFGTTINKEELTLRLDKIKHRGNIKEAEIHSGNNYFLGCQRLAIISPESGKQPAVNENKTIEVVFNGEIYNFKELKETLSNHTFETDCDTEVIVHLYEQWGMEGFKKLNGMFAFVLWNHRTGEYIAIRDPLGVKPLYYVNVSSGDSITFASEQKALVGLDGAIRTLPPGHYLTQKAIGKYFYFNFQSEEFKADKLRNLLETSIKRRLYSSHSSGVFLSGGLDSALLTSCIKQFNPNIKAYSVGMEGSEDLFFSKRYAKEFNIDLETLTLSADLIISKLPEIIYHLESYNPFLVRSGVGTYFASQLAAKNESVIFSGEGADELFAGYSYLRSFPFARYSALLKEGINNLHQTELQRLDRMSMVHTLEAREPFLDIDLVQYAFSIPVNSKIRPWESSLQKLCLRKTYEDLLPEYIINRPKVPFDKGSAIDAVLHKHINKEFSDKAFEAEKNKYTYLRSRDKETMFYFLIWKEFFLPASQTFVLDRGRYVNYDEIPLENIINF